jgi:hypothetical protein
MLAGIHSREVSGGRGSLAASLTFTLAKADFPEHVAE